MDKKIEKAIYPLTQMYENIENDLLKKIASHFLYNEEFLNSDYWRIKKLDEMGLFNEEIINYIARYSNKTKEKVLKALNEIGIETININNLNRLFEDEVLKVNPNILVDNYVIKNMINSAYNKISNHFIEMSSKIENATRESYLSVIEECYLKTSMGTHSYQEAIRESIDKLGNSGITTLTYTTTDEEGNVVGIRKYDVSSTARREILTGARQLANNINLEVANELNCEYLYLSEHLECRPDHFDWQGTIIKKEDLIPITDYGSVTGLCGINCKHYAEPYFGDKRGDELKQFNKEETTKAYELSQKQRYLERGVRKWKRKAEMFKVNEDKEAYIKSNNKVKEWQLKVKDFTEKNNRRRDFTREYIANTQSSEKERKGINIKGKVNWNIVNSKEYKNKFNITSSNKINNQMYSVANKILTHRDNSLREDMYLLDGKSGEILATQTNMKTELNITYNPQMKIAISKNKNIIAIHNHPLSMPPSIDDINSAFEKKYKLGVILTHDGGVYTYNIKKMKMKVPKREYEIAVEKFTKMYYNNSKKGQLEALEQLSKLYNFEFKEV